MSKQEEIGFFKKQKPYIYSRLKFFAKLYQFLLEKPLGSIASQRTYIDEAIKKLQDHNQKKLDFVKYYREGATYLDKYYFIRGERQYQSCHGQFAFLYGRRVFHEP